MTIFDRRRLPASVFKLDVDRMRRGWYSDKYFINIALTLGELAFCILMPAIVFVAVEIEKWLTRRGLVYRSVA